MKRRILSIFVAIILALTPILFVACESDSDFNFSSGSGSGSGSGSTGSGSINIPFDGFKVVYANSMTGEGPDLEKLKSIEGLNDKILVGLNKFYGSGEGVSDSDLDKFFPDSIRQLIVKDNATGKGKVITENDKDIEWNWNLGEASYSKKDVVSIMEESETYEEFVDTRFLEHSDDYPKFLTYYETALKIILFEVLLGYKENITTFGPSSNPEIIKVKACPNKVSLKDKSVYDATLPDNADAEVLSYLEELQDKYYSTATYFGLTKADADSLITYILDKVIGDTVVDYDYVNYGPDQTTNTYNYRNYVGKVAEIIYSQVYDPQYTFEYTYKTKSGAEVKYTFDYDAYKTYYEGIHSNETYTPTFSPKSVACLSDFETDTFFESSNAFEMFGSGNKGNAFEKSPLAEYHSVTIMPRKTDDFGGMLLQIFSPNPDLQINLYVRYYIYDPSLDLGVFEWKQEDINFYHSTPYDTPYEKVNTENQVYVEGKGYLYKTKDKDNAGNSIVGYYTEFEVGVDLEGVPSKYALPKDSKPVTSLQLDTVMLSKFENFDKGDDGVQMKAVGTSVNGRVEAQLDDPNYGYAYKVIESKNGFGGLTVLDETKVKSSFYEVVFDVVKDPTLKDQNYDFKLAIITPI